MTTSQPATFLSEVISGVPIPPEKLGYFRGRFSNRLHELLLDLFVELERAGKITRASLARRIGKAPEQITRWLGAPGNLTLDTVSDLFLGMGYEPAVAADNLSEQVEPGLPEVNWSDLPEEASEEVVSEAYAIAGGFYFDNSFLTNDPSATNYWVTDQSIGYNNYNLAGACLSNYYTSNTAACSIWLSTGISGLQPSSGTHSANTDTYQSIFRASAAAAAKTYQMTEERLFENLQAKASLNAALQAKTHLNAAIQNAMKGVLQ